MVESKLGQDAYIIARKIITTDIDSRGELFNLIATNLEMDTQS